MTMQDDDANDPPNESADDLGLFHGVDYSPLEHRIAVETGLSEAPWNPRVAETLEAEHVSVYGAADVRE